MKPQIPGRLTTVGQACLTLTLMGSLALTAHAQTTDSGAAEATTATSLGTVVVTSQKRAELLKDVPQAVSAFSASDLQAQGITSATDLRMLSPSLQFKAGADSRNEGFQMRGVGTSAFADTIEQSVGFTVDGVALARSGQGSGGLVDIERVEVLRGPQGMLFGKNASAGLVSVVTKRPVLNANTLEGSLSFGNKFNEQKTEVIANAALGEESALRIAYASTKADGTVQNVKTGDSLNNRNENMLRAKALFNINDKLDLYLIADSGQSRTLCCAWTARSAPAGTTFAVLNAANGIVPGPDNTQIAANSPFYSNNDNKGFSAEVNYDMGWATLTSLTAWREWNTVNNNDPDILPLNILDINLGQSRLTQRSQELRLTSPSGQAFEWVTGLYLSAQQNESLQEQTGNFGGLFTRFGVPVGANLGVIQNTTTRNDSTAVFGQAGMRMGTVKLSAGARLTNETVTLDYASTPSTAIKRPGYAYGTTTGNADAHNLSWRLTAQNDFTRNDMAYATVARGYKGPGLEFLDNGNGPVSTIRPEIPTTVEAGWRSLLGGGSTYFNAALFKTRFEDFQAQVFDQTVTPAKFRTTNAGRLDTQGLELELNSRVTSAWTVGGSLAYVDATYGDFANIPCYAGQTVLPAGTVRTSSSQCITTNGANVTDATGKVLAISPKLTANLQSRYDWRFDGKKAFVQLNYAYRSDVNYSAAGDPLLAQDAYGLWGGSIGYGAANGAWGISLWGKNLTDQRYVETIMPQPTLGGAGISSQFISPNAYRSLGVTLMFKLGK